MGDSPASSVGQGTDKRCKDTQTELAERVAAIDVAVGPDIASHNGQETPEESDSLFCNDAANSQRNGFNVESGASQKRDGAQELNAPKRVPARPMLSGRKYSLQERPSGNYLTSANAPGFGPYATGPSTRISPRIMRRPTIESHRVSISDAVVSSLPFVHNR